MTTPSPFIPRQRTASPEEREANQIATQNADEAASTNLWEHFSQPDTDPAEVGRIAVEARASLIQQAGKNLAATKSQRQR